MVESSFLEQYGIRLNQVDDMSWKEFSALLHGISAETALGRMVNIRAEEDKEILKSFTADQKAERTRWRTSQATQIDEADMEKEMENLEKMFANAFS
ncbi:hypothetical protein J3A84_04880 [Proteiniclasticum sp. SCR006]|uniref:Bacteriophage Gp15 protein n=2 Tax=Proteiniclasticum aestuarii TaxID=2817862 RepID=A0A939KK53_9CLOT|nr:hypothetical protein [Proteiniclasticum aestuarii]